MRTLIAVIAAGLVLATCSTSMAQWGYVAPTAVEAYYPGVPVYAYPAPVVVARPIYAPAPIVVARPVVVASPVVVPAPMVVRARVFVPGQPVRNALRATLP